MNKKKVLLTGDRPTGSLHLGHFKGSLENRLVLQDTYDSYIMIADSQALTDHSDQSKSIGENVYGLVLDYLSVGIDPDKVTIFVESMIPAIPELAQYYLNLVSLNRLHHNPTVKNEMKQKGFETSVPAGFIVYPVFQAADITCVGATVVPVGADQKPMLEQTNEIIRKWTQLYGPMFEEVEGVYSQFSRLPGIDGKAKMSKTLNNAIYLRDDPKSIEKKVKKMFTDPNHLKVEDPGTIEGNTVFTYLDAFGQEKHAAEIRGIKRALSKGGVRRWCCEETSH